MLGSWPHDLLTLARVALEAAIRNEGDLIELLSGDPPTSRRSARQATETHDSGGMMRLVRRVSSGQRLRVEALFLSDGLP